MRSLAIVAVVATCVLLAGCDRPDVEQVTTTIKSMTADMAKEMNSGVMDTSMSRYAADCVSLPNYGPRLNGKEAIRKYYMQMAESGVKLSDVKFEVVNVLVDRMYAIETGNYTMTVEMAAMPPMTDEGKYITVWEKQTDGSWKIKVETWNTNKMPMMPAMEEEMMMGKEKMDKK